MSRSRFDVDPVTLLVRPRKADRPKPDAAARSAHLRATEDDQRTASRINRR